MQIYDVHVEYIGCSINWDYFGRGFSMVPPIPRYLTYLTVPKCTLTKVSSSCSTCKLSAWQLVLSIWLSIPCR